MVKVCQARRRGLETGLLVNQARSPREAFELHRKFNEIVGRFLEVSILKAGYILKDVSVEQAARAQQPVVLSHPDSIAAGCIVQLAQLLVPKDAVLQVDGPGLFERLMGRIALRAGA